MKNNASAKRGLVAAGLGLALLTGVGGTFAYWSDSKDASGGTVTAGNMSLAMAGTGTWYDCHNTSDATSTPVDDTNCTEIADIGAFKMVPGDHLKYLVEATPTLVGDHLKAEYKVTFTGATTGTGEFKVTTPTSTGTVLTTADTGTARPVVISVNLPFDTATNASMNKSYSFTGINVALTQVNPGA